MAWTAPTTRATGDLITAGIWNGDLVDNLTWLGNSHDHSGDAGDGGNLLWRFLDVDISEVPVSGTIKTTLATFSVPGNTLGTSNVLMYIIPFIYSGGSGATYKFLLDYGSTTVVTGNNVAAYLSGVGGTLFAYLKGNGGTALQSGLVDGRVTESTNGSSVGSAGNGTATEDSTATKSITVSAQLGATGSPSLTAKMKMLYLLNNT